MKHLARILTAALLKGAGLMEWSALVACAVLIGIAPGIAKVAYRGWCEYWDTRPGSKAAIYRERREQTQQWIRENHDAER